MSTSCCCCYFDYYLLKINRQPEFLKKTESLNDGDWPKNPLTDFSFPYFKSVPRWYSQAPGLLFHAWKPCIIKLLEISTVGNHANVNEILSRMCHFVNSQWITTEENCLDKIYYSLGSKAGSRDLDVCPQCKMNLCFSVIYREFNCLDKFYVLEKGAWICLFDMLIGITHEDIIANILCFVSGLSFGYYIANLKKDSNSAKQLNDELIIILTKTIII